MATNTMFLGQQFGDNQLAILSHLSEGAILVGGVDLINRNRSNYLSVERLNSKINLRERDIIRLMKKGAIKIAKRQNVGGKFIIYTYDLTSGFSDLFKFINIFY